MIQTQVSSSRPVSRKAEKFSTLPCPYWWSASAGLSETRTESRVMNAATRSSAEWAASESIPKLPVLSPTAAFRVVIPTAANRELRATARFSSRIVIASTAAACSAITALSQLAGARGHVVAEGFVLGFCFSPYFPEASERCFDRLFYLSSSRNTHWRRPALRRSHMNIQLPRQPPSNRAPQKITATTFSLGRRRASRHKLQLLPP